MFLYKIENIFKKIIEIKGLSNLAQTYVALRLTEIFHRYTYIKRSKRMARAINRFKNCKNKKTTDVIEKEIKKSLNYWKCYPLHYFRYDLFKTDKQLSENELLNYVPEFYFYYLFLPYHNPRKMIHLVEDKNISEQLFRRLNISQPLTICKIINNRIFSDMNEINFEMLIRNIYNNNYERLFVKPINGAGGYGIYIFNRTSKMEYESRSGLIFNKKFLSTIGEKKDYIIQPGLTQDKEISIIYPHSVNTFRIATENINGKVRGLCATLRMGQGGKELDNGTQGGLLIKVDVKKGILGDHATTEENEYFERHPDTNFLFKNYKIKKWEEIKNFTNDSAKKLSEFTYLAWDIAMTENGPVAIEANFKFGLDHYQVALGGLRKILGIKDPDFYWKNKGKRK